MTAVRAEAVAGSPWTARQRLVLAVFQVLGVAGLIAGYLGTSGTLRLSRQVVWVNVAGAALLVSGAGVTVFLTAGRRAVGRRRLGLFGDVREGRGATVHPDPGPGTATDLVAATAMTKYHRGDCSFVDGKVVTAATAAEHEQGGRRPCGVCLPEGAS
jgi:hypothetical protein